MNRSSDGVVRRVLRGVALVAGSCSCSPARDRGDHRMRAFPVVLPSGARDWTVLDEDLAVVPVADGFLRQGGVGPAGAESPATSYAHSIALFLRGGEGPGRTRAGGAGAVGVLAAGARGAGGAGLGRADRRAAAGVLVGAGPADRAADGTGRAAPRRAVRPAPLRCAPAGRLAAAGVRDRPRAPACGPPRRQPQRRV